MRLYQYSFEKLLVWQHAREWVGRVYEFSGLFPKSKAFNLSPLIETTCFVLLAGDLGTFLPSKWKAGIPRFPKFRTKSMPCGMLN